MALWLEGHQGVSDETFGRSRGFGRQNRGVLLEMIGGGEWDTPKETIPLITGGPGRDVGLFFFRCRIEDLGYLYNLMYRFSWIPTPTVIPTINQREFHPSDRTWHLHSGPNTYTIPSSSYLFDTMVQTSTSFLDNWFLIPVEIFDLFVTLLRKDLGGLSVCRDGVELESGSFGHSLKIGCFDILS